MFGMSGTELVIILVLALLLLGPDKLPEVAKMVGKGMRDFQRATDDIKSTMTAELDKMARLAEEDPKPERAESPNGSNVVELKPALGTVSASDPQPVESEKKDS